MGRKRITLSPGEKYGKLTIVREAKSSYRSRFLCMCDCGTETILFGPKITSGEVTSCGCWRRTWSLKHGKSKTNIYALWNAMRNRCDNPKSEVYKNYGGRGIKVCERWKSFENFYKDMGDRPHRHTLDRIDNDGPYSPENCRWATYIEQANNKRSMRLITFKGKTMSVSQWQRELGLPVANRLWRHWTIEEAFTSPVRNRSRKPK